MEWNIWNYKCCRPRMKLISAGNHYTKEPERKGLFQNLWNILTQLWYHILKASCSVDVSTHGLEHPKRGARTRMLTYFSLCMFFWTPCPWNRRQLSFSKTWKRQSFFWSVNWKTDIHWTEKCFWVWNQGFKGPVRVVSSVTQSVWMFWKPRLFCKCGHALPT